jgi:hypothetical protein
MHIAKTTMLATILSAALANLSPTQAAPPSGAKHLHQLTCQAGQIAKFNGARWDCAEEMVADDALAAVPKERFVDNGDGTITDIQTGLMWEKKDAADGSLDLTNPHDVDNIYSWSSELDEDNTNPDGSAFTNFLATLNQETTNDPQSTCFANHCDWRLPRLAELQTIVAESCDGSPCIDPVFGATAASAYWSSTSNTDSPVSAFVVHFDLVDPNVGPVSLGGKATGGWVRAVRGGR